MMQPGSDIGRMRVQDQHGGTPEAESPVTSGQAPGGAADMKAIDTLAHAGMNPQHVASMSRSEDDPIVFATSPEFHDRPGHEVAPESPVGQQAERTRRSAVKALATPKLP